LQGEDEPLMTGRRVAGRGWAGWPGGIRSAGPTAPAGWESATRRSGPDTGRRAVDTGLSKRRIRDVTRPPEVV